jgi:hypothetical protein
MIPPDETIAWRLNVAEQKLRDLDMEKAEAKDLIALADEVHGLRRALMVFALSMVGTALMFVLGVLALVAQ